MGEDQKNVGKMGSAMAACDLSSFLGSLQLLLALKGKK